MRDFAGTTKRGDRIVPWTPITSIAITAGGRISADVGLAARRRRALWIALGANGAFLVVQVFAGIAFGSLALLADAVHMVSDVAALAIALVAAHLATAAPSRRHTYGLVRAEVIGAQINALLLLGAAAWIVYEAVQRLDDPTSVDGAGVVVVAVLGLFVNGGSAWVVGRSAGESLNLRARSGISRATRSVRSARSSPGSPW